MAKRVLPINVDERERKILRMVAEREGVSMAEVVRRQIRKLAFEVMEPAPAAIDRAAQPTADAH